MDWFDTVILLPGAEISDLHRFQPELLPGACGTESYINKFYSFRTTTEEEDISDFRHNTRIHSTLVFGLFIAFLE